MDYQLEQLINGPAGTHPALDAIMQVAAGWAEPIFMGIVVLWFLVGWLAGRRAERYGAIAALLSAGVALGVNFVVSCVWFRPRPFLAHPDTVHVLLSHSTDASFPSDHASAAFAIIAVLLAFRPKLGTVAFVFGLLLLYARVYVGDHYPGDVAAGAVIGLLVGASFASWLAPVPAAFGRLADGIILALRLPLPSAARSHPVGTWRQDRSCTSAARAANSWPAKPAKR